MNKRLLLPLAFMMFTAVAFLLGSCSGESTGNSPSTATENSGTADRKPPGASSGVNGPVGGETDVEDRGPSDQAWPMGLPEGLPKPVGLNPVNYSRTTVDGVETWTINLKDAKVSELAKYETVLQSNGFKTSMMSGNGNGLLNAKKDNIMVTCNLTDGQQTLTVAVR